MIPKVGIIIVNYNGGEDTLECLDSLKNVDYQNYEVIMVDNASDSASFILNKIHDYFPRIKILALPRNHGFSGGNNVGINYALENGATYALLLNNDTVVAPDFITQLIAAAESDEKIGMVGAKIYYFNEENRIWYNGGEFSWTDGGKHTQAGAVDAKLSDAEVKDTAYVTGCALLIKKQAIDKIGLLCEDFFMYYEDIDWSLRARQAGYRTVVAPAAHIWHKVSRSASKMGVPAIHYYHARNALLLAKRNASLPTRLAMCLWSAFHCAKQTIKIIIFPSTRPISIAIMRGILDFYRGKFGPY